MILMGLTAKTFFFNKRTKTQTYIHPIKINKKSLRENH
jgi:hypothetical protein